MKSVLSVIIKTLSISLIINLFVLPQTLQSQLEIVENQVGKRNFDRPYYSTFDNEKTQNQRYPQQKIFGQRRNSSLDNLFDDMWTLQHPYPTDVHLLATTADNNFMISSGYSWYLDAVYSDLIISIDDGASWALQKFRTDTIITNIDKVGNLIWLGGGEFYSKDGFVMRSTDLGNSWEEKLFIDSFGVTYLNFFDDNNGVVISENEYNVKIFHTTDGGTSWTEINKTFFGWSGLKQTYFLNPNYGWQCLNGNYPTNVIINTTDGGENWAVVFEDTIDSFEMIRFADLNHGWTAGVKEGYPNSELKIYTTTNGGADWDKTLTFQNEYFWKGCDISSIDNLNCWLAVSFDGELRIFRTTNGGINWDEISQLQIGKYWPGYIEFVSETEGWITSGLGMIFYTSDGGYSWTQKNKSLTWKDFYALDFVNENIGWAATAGNNFNDDVNVILKTNNGGVDWNIVYSDSFISYLDMDFVTDQTGFVISNNYIDSNYTIDRTLDGGFTWNSTQFGDAELDRIFFTDTENGWAVGSNNSDLFIVHTSNSGIDWVQQSNINYSGGSLNNLHFYNSQYGFAVGDNGIIIKTTDGGNSWVSAQGNSNWTYFEMTGVFMSGLTDCWVVGSPYVDFISIGHTTDGGETWDITSLPSYYQFSGDILFINQSVGYCLRNYSGFKTTDGGTTWTELDYPTFIKRMVFINQGTGWAAGSRGTIFKYYDSNARVDEGTITKFLLEQNYPNPFNPSTKISWQVPVGSWQTLIVYDVLGNEIATLVDEFKSAGNHKIEWNAADLSSGVYFYQLKTKNFIETKKMILMK
jgi:photosystem II stability/assembly factor-like uncharacterized protein